MGEMFGDYREHLRLERSFVVNLHKVGVPVTYEGVTKNISQGGAFIRTKDWECFQENDQTLITFYLPPNFTGQDSTTRLLGAGQVTRVDSENGGLGFRFNKTLRQFEKVD